ncbi:MAG TPA: lipoyl(octanoyl) transferase LipB [Thermoanaerobaculia bacterium]|nr:lipoyl(octanoyl) transferase LipB [Thermoanaerobaculia bacterium]
MRACDVRRLHLVTYENGMAMQERLVAMRQKDEIDDQLLLLQHTPVITLGRGGDIENLLAPKEVFSRDGIRFFETTRGGDITYHGPGQLVGYPILHLGEGNRDVRKYVGNVEETVIRTLADWGIRGTREDGKRGVWVGNDKVAAIGVRVARWVTCHGFALNVTTNLDHFRHITPCGIAEGGVTSLEKLLGKAPAMKDVMDAYVRHFADVFERETEEREPAIRLVKVVPHDGEKVLLLRRHPDRGEFWQPVTGRIEPGETPGEAARRELAEETGCDATPREIGLRQSFLIDPAFLPAPPESLPFVDETSYEVKIPRG